VLAYVKFKLPFCLYLKDGGYELVVPEFGVSDKTMIYLSKFRREQSKIDYVTGYGAERVGRGELWNDRSGIFRRTEVIVILPMSYVSFDIGTDLTTPTDRIQPVFEAAVTAINRLIAVYRYVTQDTYIPLIKTEEVINTFQIGNCTVNADGALIGTGRDMINDFRLTNTRTDYDDAAHLDIQAMLVSGAIIPLHEEYIMNARAFLEEGNWRMAAIEAQTGFEVLVAYKIRDYYSSAGRSSSQINGILQSGFRNLISAHLPRATGKSFATGEPNYDQWYHDSYLLRNRVVHEGYSPKPQEAVDAVLGVECVLEYLIGRPKGKSWHKGKPPTVINEFFVADNNDS